MAYLPGLDDETFEFLKFTTSQKKIYISLCYLAIFNYMFLLVLALHNTFAIVLRQQEYKNLPILVFYAYALIATSLRPIYIMWFWTSNPAINNLDYIQQAAKLCLGVV